MNETARTGLAQALGGVLAPSPQRRPDLLQPLGDEKVTRTRHHLRVEWPPDEAVPSTIQQFERSVIEKMKDHPGNTVLMVVVGASKDIATWALLDDDTVRRQHLMWKMPSNGIGARFAYPRETMPFPAVVDELRPYFPLTPLTRPGIAALALAVAVQSPKLAPWYGALCATEVRHALNEQVDEPTPVTAQVGPRV